MLKPCVLQPCFHVAGGAPRPQSGTNDDEDDNNNDDNDNNIIIRNKNNDYNNHIIVIILDINSNNNSSSSSSNNNCNNNIAQVRGRLRCIGTVDHIKGAYGSGYQLEVELM